MATPTQDDYEELILSCRYGDLEDVESFISQFGVDHLATARDEHGNTILHMAAANGHTGMSSFLTSFTHIIYHYQAFTSFTLFRKIFRSI